MLPYKLPLILLFCSVLSTSANDSGVRRCPEGLLRKILTSFHKRPFKNNERTWEILSKKNLLVSQQEAGKQGMCGPTCSLNAIQVVLARSLGRPFTNPKERLVQIAKRFSEKGTSMLENIEILEELLRPRIPGIEIRGVELEGLHTINPSAPISAISPQISSFGSFRIYENRYPLYARKKKNGKWSVQTTWRPLAPGSVTLSYEEEDMKPVEGLRFSLYFPRLTNYYYRYNINNVKELTLGDLFYSHLKDQIFRINDGFMTSYAFRTQGALPETYFIMTKKCDLIDAATSELVKPSECPRR